MKSDDWGIRYERCKAEASTKLAILVDIPDLEKKVWVPKHVLHEESEIRQSGDMGELVVKTWFAEWEES